MIIIPSSPSQRGDTPAPSCPAQALLHLVSFVMGYISGFVSPVPPLAERSVLPKCRTFTAILNVIIEIETSILPAVQGCILEIDIILKSS
jgi:hypothetical protein